MNKWILANFPPPQQPSGIKWGEVPRWCHHAIIGEKITKAQIYNQNWRNRYGFRERPANDAPSIYIHNINELVLAKNGRSSMPIPS